MTVDTTWAELQASQPARTERTRFVLEQLAELLAEPRPAGTLMASAFAARGAGFACVAICEGPALALDLFEPSARFIAPALEELDEDVARGDPLTVLDLLEFLSALRACGLPEADATAEMEPGLLAAVGERLDLLDETERRGLSLLALAAGRPDLAVPYAELPQRPVLQPGATFGFNVQGYVGQLAAALEEGAGPEPVRPAWQEFVELFPGQLAARTLQWPDLLLAARAHYVHFEGEPIETVAARLHALVT